MKTDNLLILPDGRKLSYAEYGQPDGYPVLYCHAIPSSRLEPLYLGDEIFSQFGLRVISPDRPGMAGSGFQSQRGYSNWPKDVFSLLEALGLDQFSVLGISGGGGYAAVCTAKIPERLSKVVIASGAWQVDAEVIKAIGYPLNMMWQVTTYAPFLFPLVIKMLSRIMSQPPKGGFDQESTLPNNTLPAVDHAVIAQPGRVVINRRILGEVMKQGTKGPAWDYRTCVRKWDFGPTEIQIPLTLFHGELDGNFPLSFVQRIAKRLPHAELIIYPDDAHISTYANHFDEIAQALLPDL